jgi:hypothetical protein
MLTAEKQLMLARQRIDDLRKLGTPDAIRIADRLQLQVQKWERDIDSPASMTVEMLRDWALSLRADVEKYELPLRDPTVWPEHLQDDLCELLSLAWPASGFLIRQCAHLTSFDGLTVKMWISSEWFSKKVRAGATNALRVASIVDLTISRMAQIMSIQTDDPETLRLQASIGRSVLGGGFKVEPPEEEKKLSGGHADIVDVNDPLAPASAPRTVLRVKGKD